MQLPAVYLSETIFLLSGRGFTAGWAAAQEILDKGGEIIHWIFSSSLGRQIYVIGNVMEPNLLPLKGSLGK